MVFSNVSVAGDGCSIRGVLVVAHGSHKHDRHFNSTPEHDHWNETVSNAVEELKQRLQFPVELAFGMWDKDSFQRGIDKLVAKNVCELKVIPLFISSDSEVIEVQKYMFGVREDLNFPINVGRLRIPSQIKIVQYGKALDTHEYVSEILEERISELSQHPQAEGILLLAHGPYTDLIEPRWIELLKVHGDRIQQDVLRKRGEKFGDISYFTLRDDSPSNIRNERTRLIREKVNELNQKNIRPLVIPVILSAGGIESGILERLEGLRYFISREYLMPHTKIIDWLELSAKN
jgi:hypothetical protein